MIKGPDLSQVEWWGGNGQKRKRHGKDREVEEGLLHWLEHLRSRDEKVNGRMLCRKAEEIAERLGRIDFKVTTLVPNHSPHNNWY